MSDTATVDPVEGQSTPPSIWDSPSLAKFKDGGEVAHDKLAQSYIELEKMMGSRVALPGPNATSEDIQRYYAKTRPATKDEYTFVMPGIDNLEPGEVDKWKTRFHEKGFNQDQVDGVLSLLTDDIIETQKRNNTQTLQQQTETQVALKAEWGANYEANQGMILAGLREMGGEDLVETMKPILDYDTNGAKYLYQVAQYLRSSDLLKNDGGGNFGMKTVEEAQVEKHAIYNDPNNPLYRSMKSQQSLADRQPAIDRILQLNTIIANANRRLGGS